MTLYLYIAVAAAFLLRLWWIRRITFEYEPTYSTIKNSDAFDEMVRRATRPKISDNTFICSLQRDSGLSMDWRQHAPPKMYDNLLANRQAWDDLCGPGYYDHCQQQDMRGTTARQDQLIAQHLGMQNWPARSDLQAQQQDMSGLGGLFGGVHGILMGQGLSQHQNWGR